MATKLRLVRKGKKNRPFYRIVAVDDRKDGNGDVLEVIGTYDPLLKDGCTVNDQRVTYWLGVGAQPSDTVGSLLKKKGLLVPAEGK